MTAVEDGLTASVIVCVVPPEVYVVDRPPANVVEATVPPTIDILVVELVELVDIGVGLELEGIDENVNGTEEPLVYTHPDEGRLATVVEHDLWNVSVMT